ncbi:MAG: response regulator [Hyphomicrobiaceae bacterium]
MTSPLKILILDDDVDVAEGLSDILELQGHDVTMVHNGLNAIEAYTNNDFDVGFFDVKMPGMNGVESFIEIKKIKPDVKVFMMTGYSVEQLLEEALDHGALGVMRKPFDVDELIAKIDGLKEGLIVVADAEPDFTDQVVPTLEGHGYDVLVARSGPEAMKAVEGTLDLLILDFGQPILSGLEVYLELKKRGNVVPTVVVTTQNAAQSDGMDKLRSHAISGFFHKPFNIDEFIETIQKVEAKAA